MKTDILNYDQMKVIYDEFLGSDNLKQQFLEEQRLMEEQDPLMMVYDIEVMLLNKYFAKSYKGVSVERISRTLSPNFDIEYHLTFDCIPADEIAFRLRFL